MNLSHIVRAIRYFGPGPIFQGTWHRIIKKTWFFKRRFSTIPWNKLRLESLVKYDLLDNSLRQMLHPENFFPLNQASNEKTFFIETAPRIDRNVIESANNIIAGKFKYFSRQEVRLQSPINWHINPFSKAEWPKDIHWCNISCFVKELGDIKCVWELSRFSWAYNLVRAYLITGNEKYSEKFWELFESWFESNQPNLGVNWVSGQECALRVMAWCFCLFGFLGSPSATENRIKNLLLAIGMHGHRIEKFISHAVRQKTNHAITEAGTLYTIGTIFPFFQRASRWKALGKKILEQEGIRQIYEDGSYIQQSTNYHRLMLQAYLWSFRLAELNGDGFSSQLKKRLLKATEFLFQLQDNSTGRVPNYGPNDGALILPLNNCDYLDYRPAIQSIWYLLTHEKLYESGPWDEDMLWLFGPRSLTTARTNKLKLSQQFRTGGYYTFRCNKSWGMIRCHSYRDRPGHVDLLHLDLWSNGINLLRDSGTYQYYIPNEPELEYYFKSIWAHNTIVVDRNPAIELVSRFMWLPWPRTELITFEETQNKIRWKGAHFAYKHPPYNITHSRTVVIDKEQDRWEITDEIAGHGSYNIELRWHLPFEVESVNSDMHSICVKLPSGWFLTVKSPNKISTEFKKSDRNGGFESLYYNEKTPITTLIVNSYCRLPEIFKTSLSPGITKAT